MPNSICNCQSPFYKINTIPMVITTRGQLVEELMFKTITKKPINASDLRPRSTFPVYDPAFDGPLTDLDGPRRELLHRRFLLNQSNASIRRTTGTQTPDPVLPVPTMLKPYNRNPLTIHIASHTGSEVRGEGNNVPPVRRRRISRRRFRRGRPMCRSCNTILRHQSAAGGFHDGDFVGVDLCVDPVMLHPAQAHASFGFVPLLPSVRRQGICQIEPTEKPVNPQAYPSVPQIIAPAEKYDENFKKRTHFPASHYTPSTSPLKNWLPLAPNPFSPDRLTAYSAMNESRQRASHLGSFHYPVFQFAFRFNLSSQSLILWPVGLQNDRHKKSGRSKNLPPIFTRDL